MPLSRLLLHNGSLDQSRKKINALCFCLLRHVTSHKIYLLVVTPVPENSKKMEGVYSSKE
jgi:hypothetical protein